MKKITLTGRKRTKDLKQSEVTTDAKKAFIQAELKQTQVQPPDKSSNTNIALAITNHLLSIYGHWLEPLDKNRYYFSPNQRKQKLIEHIKLSINDYAAQLLQQGKTLQHCQQEAQELLIEINFLLKANNVKIGQLYLKSEANVERFNKNHDAEKKEVVY